MVRKNPCRVWQRAEKREPDPAARVRCRRKRSRARVRHASPREFWPCRVRARLAVPWASLAARILGLPWPGQAFPSEF